ncbi:MAG TPA: hypothetical protein VHE79_01780 [Spirochaetia bacterium]
MKRFALGLAAVLSIVLASCATTYQPLDGFGGYVDYPTTKDQYHLFYVGNSYTSEDTVYQLFLTRAAQLALDNHFKYFYVLSQENVSTTQTVVTPGTVHVIRRPDHFRVWVRSRYGDVGYVRTVIGGPTVTVIDPPIVTTVGRPGFRGEILLANDPLPDQPAPFEAERIYKDGQELKARLDAYNQTVEWSVVGVAVAVVVLGIAFQ